MNYFFAKIILFKTIEFEIYILLNKNYLSSSYIGSIKPLSIIMKRKKQTKQFNKLTPLEGKAEIPKMEAEAHSEKNSSSQKEYSYTKKGDWFTIIFAGFFAFVFLAPGLSVGLLGEDLTAGLICFIIGLIPLKYVLKEFYTIKITVTKNEASFTHTALFKKTISWKEPLAYYSHFSKFLSEDENTCMLWHSYDDSKNLILHTSYYKSKRKALETFEEITAFLKNSSFNKKQKNLQVERDVDYIETNFFDVYNQSKNESKSIKRFLFPDNNIKILKDEPSIFLSAFNYNYKIFFVGLCLLGISFLMLPLVYKIGGVAFWCFVFHLLGILLYNFGTSEQTLRLERRTLSIGRRIFKRKFKELELIPFANIVSVDVVKQVSATEKAGQIYFLKIFTENSYYEYGRGSKKEELEWLADTILDRVIKINDKFIIKQDSW